MQIILTYHYNSLYDIYTYIYTHLFILFPFHPGLVFGKKNQNPFSQPRLKSTWRSRWWTTCWYTSWWTLKRAWQLWWRLP